MYFIGHPIGTYTTGEKRTVKIDKTDSKTLVFSPRIVTELSSYVSNDEGKIEFECNSRNISIMVGGPDGFYVIKNLPTHKITTAKTKKEQCSIDYKVGEDNNLTIPQELFCDSEYVSKS